MFWIKLLSNLPLLNPLKAVWTPLAFPSGYIIYRLLDSDHYLILSGLDSLNNLEIWNTLESSCYDKVVVKK